MSVDQQILDALAALLTPAATGAASVHVERDDTAEPFEPDELPAINLLAVEVGIANSARMGFGQGVPVQQDRTMALVVQVVYRGTDSARRARSIGAEVERLIGQDPMLGGLCSLGFLPDGYQWLRDDSAERPLTRQNTRFVGAYRTHSNDPNTSI